MLGVDSAGPGARTRAPRSSRQRWGRAAQASRRRPIGSLWSAAAGRHSECGCWVGPARAPCRMRSAGRVHPRAHRDRAKSRASGRRTEDCGYGCPNRRTRTLGRVKVVLCDIAVAARQRFVCSGDFARLRRERAPTGFASRIGACFEHADVVPLSRGTSAHASPHVLAPTTMALTVAAQQDPRRRF